MPSLQNLKYINMFFGIVCIAVCIFCMYYELNAYIADTKAPAQIIIFSFTIVNLVTCCLLVVGAHLMQQNYLIPWMTCLPLTILNFNVVFLLVLEMIWSIMTAMLISIFMWLFVLKMFLVLLQKNRRLKTEMPVSNLISYQVSGVS